MAHLLSTLLFLGVAAAQSTITSRPLASALHTSIRVPDLGFSPPLAISINDAEPCLTNFVAQCTAGATCDISAPIRITGHVGPSFHVYAETRSSSGTSVQITESCAVSASSRAVCVLAFVTASSGTTKYTYSTFTSTQTYNTVVVTAGTLPTGSCTATTVSYSPAATTGPSIRTGVIFGSGIRPASITSTGGNVSAGSSTISTVSTLTTIPSTTDLATTDSTTTTSSATSSGTDSAAQVSTSTKTGAAAAATAQAIYKIIVAPAVVAAVAAVL